MFKFLVLLPISLLFAFPIDVIAQSSTLKVISFNIRYDNPKDTGNLWIDRKEKIAQLIQFHQADIVGIQEGLHHQLEQLDNLLPEFDWLGVGRDDGKQAGEYTAIFFRKDRLSPNVANHFWLSETPEVPGSMSWETACTRMVSHVKFQDKITGQSFYHFNTHFDHKSEEAQYQGAFLLIDQIAEIAKEDLIILTGDFNVRKGSRTYQALAKALKDTQQMDTNSYGPSFTYQSYDQKGDPDNTIDFIFLKNDDNVDVLRHAVLSDNWNGKYPSDHLPVFLELKFK